MYVQKCNGMVLAKVCPKSKSYRVTYADPPDHSFPTYNKLLTTRHTEGYSSICSLVSKAYNRVMNTTSSSSKNLLAALSLEIRLCSL